MHAEQSAEPLTGAITLLDGTLIRGRGRREALPAGPLPDFGLYPGFPPNQPRRALMGRRPEWQPDWPDFRTPRHDPLRCSPRPPRDLLTSAQPTIIM